ncbi:MAG: alcohol dehydrogenase class IV [Planctomycetota bacterium]|jgi:alcohol dehydrogenase class IV
MPTLINDLDLPFATFGRSYCGRGCRFLLPEALSESGQKRILLIHGNTSFHQPRVQSLLAQVDPLIEFVHFTEFPANPQSQDFERALALFRTSNCDGILAIGGGTALDLGKLVSAFVGGDMISEFDDLTLADENHGWDHIPLVMLPTTSGSGAEATDFSVLYQQGKKHSFNVGGHSEHQWLSLTDSALSDCMPRQLAACSGLDALCQAAESLWSKNADAESQDLARQALKLAAENIVAAVIDACPRAGDAMSRAGHLAGRAINRSKTTAPHALSYGLSSDYSIPHGHAVALMFGPVLAINARAGNRQSQLVMDILGIESIETCTDHFKRLIASLGLSTSLTELGLHGPGAVSKLVSGVNQDRLRNNPVELSSHDLRSIYETML